MSARRSPAQITYSTWKALFLRTAVARMATSRFAWFWLLFEPFATVTVLVLLFTYLRVRHIGGISTALWITAGVLSFFFFRRAATHGASAVSATRALFAYPQIVPLDAIIVHAALEGFIMILVSILLMACSALIGVSVWPYDALAVLEAVLGLWLLGVGYGMVNSVAHDLLPPAGSVLDFLLQRPLFFLSGVIFPVTLVSYPWRDWLLLNPVVHGLEAARFGFAPYYHIPPEISIGYLYAWALGVIFFGLALQVRYGLRLARRV